MEPTVNHDDLSSKSAYEKGLELLKETRSELKALNSQMSREEYCQLSDEKARELLTWVFKHTDANKQSLRVLEESRNLLQEVRTLAYDHQLIDHITNLIDQSTAQINELKKSEGTSSKSSIGWTIFFVIMTILSVARWVIRCSN